MTVGVSYGLVSRSGAVSQLANGHDNVGMFVGFNLPAYRGRIAAGVCEAQARAMADARLYEAERDGTFHQIKDLVTQARSQRQIIALFGETILPRAKQALDVASSDYQAGRVDYLTLITAWREVLEIQLQVAQLESALGKSLASLERAVGVQLNEHPIKPATVPAPPPIPPPTDDPGLFGSNAPSPNGSVAGTGAVEDQRARPIAPNPRVTSTPTRLFRRPTDSAAAGRENQGPARTVGGAAQAAHPEPPSEPPLIIEWLVDVRSLHSRGPADRRPHHADPSDRGCRDLSRGSCH